MTENEISNLIIKAAIEIHRTLGPGLLESAYEAALVYELRKMGLHVDQQLTMPFVYKEVRLGAGYRIDLLVESLVIVELKSVESLPPLYFSQTLTYLRLSGKKLGLLINFNVPVLKDGVHRVVNNL